MREASNKALMKNIAFVKQNEIKADNVKYEYQLRRERKSIKSQTVQYDTLHARDSPFFQEWIFKNIGRSIRKTNKNRSCYTNGQTIKIYK